MAVAHRLPTDIHPRAYAVQIDADPSWSSFAGVVTMQLEATVSVSVIEMHARDLELSDARLDGEAIDVELIPATETVRFRPSVPVAEGVHTLRVAFRGRPNPGMHGLYVAHDGVERALVSQCEATDARAIFPCFDEPSFKASIEWTVRTTPNVVALANGVLKSVEEDGDYKVWSFAPTPPVSSYLAALTVGPYDASDIRMSNGTPLQVWALSGKASQTAFASEFTERLFPWYEDYFGLPYEYGKYDQVAVPGFDAGAMENVGLVLFRQNLLLMDPGSASWNQEKLIAKVIAHELAHMWFGNLVTMAWWDDLWLNEAFAEWFAHRATDAIAPQYHVWNDFQLDKNRALTDDAMETTHPVWTQVETPSQAIEMFDVITYQKGCAVMRMLERFIGEQAFRAGIRTYMKAFAGRNARGDDLWAHLEAAGSVPVGRMMRSWIEQPGFPLVKLTLEDGATVALEQTRFYSDPKAPKSEQTWNVPVRLRFEDDSGVKVHRAVLTDASERCTLPATGAVRWVYGNADEVGFYRVHHAGSALERLPIDRLSASEQMGLLEDQWSLVRNATLTIDAFVPLVERFAASRDHNVLRTLSERLWTLDRLLTDGGDASAHDAFRRRLRASFRPHLDELGKRPSATETPDSTQRRAVVLHLLGVLAEDPAVIEEARTQAAKEREDARSVDANLAGTYLSIVARFGDASLHALWTDLYKARRASGAAPQDALRYLYTLTSFRPDALTSKTLSYIKDGTIAQEAVGGLLSQLLGSHHGHRLAWRFLKDQWADVRPRIGDMGISRVVEAVGRLPASLRGEVVDFFARTPPQGAERALARALAVMDQYEELRVRATPALLQAVVANAPTE